MPKIKIHLIVVNYNTGPFIKNFLDSLKKADLSRFNLTFLVIDNNSKDDSLQIIRQEYPKAVFIKNTRNLGFAKAVNMGIKQALKKEADFVLLLNPDTIVDKDFLMPLVLFMQENSKAGITSSLLKETQEDGIVYVLGSQLNPLIGRVKHQKVSLRPLKPLNQQMVSGCMMLIKREVLEKIGFFDERFFLYFEDSDFCLRAGRAGFDIYVHPDSIVFHKVSGSFKGFSWKKIYFNLKSNAFFINKQVKALFKPLAFFYLIILSVKMISAKILSFNVKTKNH